FQVKIKFSDCKVVPVRVRQPRFLSYVPLPRKKDMKFAASPLLPVQQNNFPKAESRLRHFKSFCAVARKPHPLITVCSFLTRVHSPAPDKFTSSLDNFCQPTRSYLSEMCDSTRRSKPVVPLSNSNAMACPRRS